MVVKSSVRIKRLNKSDVSIRNWNRLVKKFGTTRIAIKSIADLSYQDFMQMEGIGHKSFVQLNDLIVSAGFQGYNFEVK